MTVLTNTLVTALAVWIPLCPFLFIFSRILRERSDMRYVSASKWFSAREVVISIYIP
jgi:hypothetical protein